MDKRGNKCLPGPQTCARDWLDYSRMFGKTAKDYGLLIDYVFSQMVGSDETSTKFEVCRSPAWNRHWLPAKMNSPTASQVLPNMPVGWGWCWETFCHKSFSLTHPNFVVPAGDQPERRWWRRSRNNEWNSRKASSVEYSNQKEPILLFLDRGMKVLRICLFKLSPVCTAQWLESTI